MPVKELPAEAQPTAKLYGMPQVLKGWQGELKLNESGGVKTRSLYNACLLLEHDDNLKDLIAFDEFSEQIVKTRSEKCLKADKGFWNDADDAVLRSYLERKYNLLFGKDNISDAVVNVARDKIINPVKTRIEAEKWDGKQRAETYFIDYLGAENNNYTKQVTRTWLAGAVTRIYQPGVKFDIVPILEGKQGMGKSTVVRNLFPEKFNDSLKGMGKQKDDYQQLVGSWILEIAELSAMRKTDIESMKNFISAQTDTYRNSYGHYSTPHPRKCVFIGTTNQSDYLKDATGERRFFPIKCGVSKPRLDPLRPDQHYIKQILAEVKCWVDKKEKLYFTNDIMAEAKKHQGAAQIIDPIKEAVEDFLEMKVPTNWAKLDLSLKHSYFKDYPEIMTKPEQRDWLNNQLSADSEFIPLKETTTREIMAVVFDKTTDKYLSGQTNSDAKKIKLIMDNIENWLSKTIRLNGKQVRGYMREK